MGQNVSVHLYTRVSDLTTGFRFLWSGDHCNLIWFKSIPTFNREPNTRPPVIMRPDLLPARGRTNTDCFIHSEQLN